MGEGRNGEKESYGEKGQRVTKRGEKKDSGKWTEKQGVRERRALLECVTRLSYTHTHTHTYLLFTRPVKKTTEQLMGSI